MSGVEIGADKPGYRQTQGSIRRIAAGVPKVAIAAAASADVNVACAEPFKPERLILSVAAQALDVTNIKIGTKSLNVTSSPISGNCFSQDALGSMLDGYTAQAGVGFTISFTNNTVASITTGGGAFGPALT